MSQLCSCQEMPSGWHNFTKYHSVQCRKNSVCLVHIYCKTINYDNHLFGKIGEFKKIAKICHRQIKTLQSLDIPVLEIAKLILRQIVIFKKTPNIIAAKYSRFTDSL